jgi:hypothetical protein
VYINIAGDNFDNILFFILNEVMIPTVGPMTPKVIIEKATIVWKRRWFTNDR